MEYKAILAIDFDDTIVVAKWPKIVGLRRGAVKYINKLYDEGYGIIINTCRSGDEEAKAKNFMKDVGLKYHLINENMPHLINLYGIDCRKMSADVYIDDKCLAYLHKKMPSWKKKYKSITKYFESDSNHNT